MGKNKDDIIELEGTVIECLPNAKFKVELDGLKSNSDTSITAHLSGKMKMHFIKILPGDKVKVELSIYDTTKGRITYRIINNKK